jgi:hypothetical protein
LDFDLVPGHGKLGLSVMIIAILDIKARDK